MYYLRRRQDIYTRRRTHSRKHPIASCGYHQNDHTQSRRYLFMIPLTHSTDLQKEGNGTEDGSQTGTSTGSGVDGTGVEGGLGGGGSAGGSAGHTGGANTGDQRGGGGDAGDDGDEGNAAGSHGGGGHGGSRAEEYVRLD